MNNEEIKDETTTSNLSIGNTVLGEDAGHQVRIASFGGGLDSSAMLIELTSRGAIMDAILFADTGGEKEETYAYVERFEKWLIKNGQPPVTIVKKVDKNGNIETLEQNCLEHQMLPSIAYGYKKCSHKFKIQPQEKWCNNYGPCKEIWEKGGKVTKYIGYDAGETHRQRPDDNKYHYVYPLIEWVYNRNKCKEIIIEAGLCLPPKSSCFFCPNMKKGEILALPPELQQRAIAIEQTAKPNLIELKGLARTHSWEALIYADLNQRKLFHDVEMYQSPCECID